MTPNTVLILGGVQFQDFEIPTKIGPFGGKQKIAKNVLIGGQRVLDAMGYTPNVVTWNGRFRGGDALSRAGQVDAMARAGAVVSLFWGGLAYQVLIESFDPEPERTYEVPYKISLEVVDDGGGVATGSSGTDSLVAGDMFSFGQVDMSGSAASSAIASQAAALTKAIQGAGSLQNAAPATLGALAAQSASLASTISSAASSDDNLIANASFAGDPYVIAQSVVNVSGQLANESALLEGGALMSRVGFNLTQGAV